MSKREEIFNEYHLISRQQAIGENLKYYYSGPCFYGHDELRFTKSDVCRECGRLRSLNYGRKNIGKGLGKFRQRKYGISEEEINALIWTQGNKCAICKLEFNDKKRQKHVDHCHQTGKIRGLLCGNCNTGLGLLKDDINILSSAANYLRYHNNGNNT